MALLNSLQSSKKFKDRIYSGAGAIDPLRNNYVDFARLPSYIFPFDYMTAGGIPLNHPVMFYGKPNGGKTTTSYLFAKALAKTCMRCLRPVAMCGCEEGPMIQKTFLLHAEGLPPDEFYFDRLGYNTDGNMIIALPDNGEECCELIMEAIKSEDCGLVIADSLARFIPQASLDKDFGENLVASQARLLTQFMHKLSHALVEEHAKGHRIGVILINQVRSSIGAGKYEPQETIPGGYEVKHSCRLVASFNQVKSENIDEDFALKQSARFSISCAGQMAKQQMLLLSGKCEYKLALMDFDGYESGTIIDHKACVNLAKDYLGIFEKEGKFYVLRGTDMKFRILSDVEEMFKTGTYVDPETGEVTEGCDDVFRFRVLDESIKRATDAIRSRRGGRVLRADTPQNEVTDESALQ